MTLFHRPLLEDISCVADLGHVRLLLHSLLVRKTNSLIMMIMMTMMVRRRTDYHPHRHHVPHQGPHHGPHLRLHHGHHVPEDCGAVWFVLRRCLLPHLLLLLSHLMKMFQMFQKKQPKIAIK